MGRTDDALLRAATRLSVLLLCVVTIASCEHAGETPLPPPHVAVAEGHVVRMHLAVGRVTSIYLGWLSE